MGLRHSRLEIGRKRFSLAAAFYRRSKPNRRWMALHDKRQKADSVFEALTYPGSYGG
jgi:hypothetical protein